MPELPEIETIKSVIEPQIKGLVVKNIVVNHPDVIAQPDSREFCRAVTGQAIASMARRGKYLMIYLKNENRIILHLRMTGRLLVTSSEEPLEKHTHIVFYLSDGRELRFSDTRRFGRFWLVGKDEADTYSGIGKYGRKETDGQCGTINAGRTCSSDYVSLYG